MLGQVKCHVGTVEGHVGTVEGHVFDWSGIGLAVEGQVFDMA